MGSFYSGFGGHKSYLGHCEGGIIYSGSGNSTPVGRYENGNIYNQFRKHVGSYSGGSIYNSSRTHIASYSGGVIYNQYLNAAVGREQVGSYDGDPAEAAALVLLFLGGDNINTRSGATAEENTTTTSSTTTYSSSSSSDTGCLSALFGLVVLLFAKILWPLIKVWVNAFWLSPIIGASWIGLGCALLSLPCSVSGLIPLVIVLVVIYAIIEVAFFPYWLVLMWQRIKKNLDWKEVWHFYGKWFLKGPVAYIDLVDLLNETNTLPRVAKFFSKLIEFFKKIFKKK